MDAQKEETSDPNMLCLHGKRAVTTTTDKGTFWFCGEPFSCNLICREEDELLYAEGVQTFLNLDQPRPMCCGILNSDDQHYARLRVVKDKSKANYGRPFFVCPKEKDPCRYFEWGDKIIEDKPLCGHGKPCIKREVKKAGKNKGRFFLCCPEKRENDCCFFQWSNPTQRLPPLKVLRVPEKPAKPDDNPLEPGSIVFFTNPPSYQYTIKATGLKFTSGESNPAKAYAEFLKKNKPSTPEKRSIDTPAGDEERKKRKTTPKKLQHGVNDKPNNTTWWRKPRNFGRKEVDERINNAIHDMRPPAQCPMPQDCDEYNSPKQKLERQIVKRFFEGLETPDECKKGNCGHFDCYDLAHKDDKECDEEWEDAQRLEDYDSSQN